MQPPLKIIALETYGSQRVRAPASGAMVSAYKIGYSTVGRATLLVLYGSRALDVTSRHASYHYVSIEGDVSAHNGFLLLALFDDELEKVKRLTCVHPSRRTGIFWWNETQWWHFPYMGQADFSLAVNRTGPSIDPTRYRVVSPSSGEKITTVDGICAEYSQRSPHEPGWWWLSGDTYPHRDLLKLKGCRWSKKRSAWYFQGATLPEAIQRLVRATPAVTPSTLSPALTAAIERALIEDDEVDAQTRTSIKSSQTPVTAVPAPRFTLGQTVYLATNVRVTVDQKLRMDTSGTIIRRYEYKKTPDFRHAFAYDVDFGTHGVHSMFQENLDNQPQNLRGIERDETVMLMFGASADKAFLANIERRQRIPQDYTVLDELMSERADSPPNLLDERHPDSVPELPSDDPEQPPAIRVLAPVLLPSDDRDLDAVQTAIRQAQQQPISASHSSPIRTSRVRTPIHQECCGELTGSITGQVYCYGFAVHQGVLVYLNFGGPRMAVEAIRAKLSKGETISLVPTDAPALELSAGETEDKANTGMYTAYLHSLPEAKFTSAILVHECITQPNYLGKSITGIFRTSDEQAMAKLLYHVRQLVNIPVFEQWSGYLYQAGQTAGLIRKPAPKGGGIDLFLVDLDESAWTRLVTGGLANGVIAFP